MEGIPIGAGIFIFACGVFVGYLWGSRFGPKRKSKNIIAEEPKGDFSTRASELFALAREATDNFTPPAHEVIALARKEADRLNHHFVGTEHVLLGLIKLNHGVAVTVLRKIGLDLESVRMEVEKLVGTGPDQKMSGKIPYTPRVRKVLSLAAKEARALGHNYVGTEHILLGLIGEGDGLAARVLKNLNVDIAQIRKEILKELDPNFGN